jgi:hypothetical protein
MSNNIFWCFIKSILQIFLSKVKKLTSLYMKICIFLVKKKLFLIFLDSVEVRLSHHFHQRLGRVSASRVDNVAVLFANLAAHDGGEVELNGGLGNIELSLAEKGIDDGLILSERAGIARSKGADELLGAVIGIVLAGNQEELVGIGDGATVTTVSVSVSVSVTTAKSAAAAGGDASGDSSDDESSDNGGLDGDKTGNDEGRV